MTTPIRRRSLAPAVVPANDAVAPSRHETAGTCFVAVLNATLQEIEHADDSPLRVQPVTATRAAPAPGPLIVAGIVLPARLPR